MVQYVQQDSAEIINITMRNTFILRLAVWTLLCLGLSPSNASAEWMFMKSDGDTLLRQGIDKIYNVEFTEAEQLFAKVIQLYPDHPAGYFMDAMIDWWKVNLFQRRHDVDERLRSKLSKVQQLCEDLLAKDEHNLTALFFKGAALGFEGRYYALRGDYINAANAGKSGMDILVALQKLAPTNRDIMFGTGVYNYYAAALPERYPLLKPVMLFLPRGDKELGILQLRAAADRARYASVESMVQLVSVYYTYEKNASAAMPYAKQLHERYPNNPLFARYLGRCYVSLGPLDTMEQTWRKVLLGYMDKRAGFDEFAAREALYYIGTAAMIRGDLELALKYYYKCDEACRALDDGPSGFMVKLNLKIGQIYDLQGKRKLALSQYQKVLGWKDYDGTQQQAELYTQQPYSR